MGKINQGILGGFSGKVGSVIGGSWKGISYMRSQAQSINNPRTVGQVGQRNKFTLVSRFTQAASLIINIGYKKQAKGKTPANVAMSYILKNAIKGAAPDFEIDFPKVYVSRGDLIGVEITSTKLERGMVIVDWIDNTSTGNASREDEILQLVYNIDKQEAICRIAVKRHTQILGITYPTSWIGDDIAVFIGLVSEDGKLVSDSQYLGEYVVPAAV